LVAATCECFEQKSFKGILNTDISLQYNIVQETLSFRTDHFFERGIRGKSFVHLILNAPVAFDQSSLPLYK